jgi:probable HAF family extracellular repeat protein
VPSADTSWFQPLDINNAGEIVGRAWFPQGSGLPVYRSADGGMQILGSLSAQHPDGSAEAINHQGQIVGSSTEQGDEGVVWQPDGSIIDLDAIAEASGKNFNWAADVNESGQVVGSGTFRDAGVTVERAFAWSQQTGLLDLGVLPGFQNSNAAGINDLGQVVGTSNTPNDGGGSAFVWTQATGMSALGNLPAGVVGSGAYAINNSGQVLGSVAVLLPNELSFEKAVRWEADGLLKEIDTLDFSDVNQPIRGIASWGSNMNNLGQIVGTNQALTVFVPFYYDRPFLWDDEWGVLDVRNLIDETGNGWTIVALTGINDLGQIIGWANGPDGQSVGFLLNPVPEPQSLALAAGCIALLLCWRKDRVR